MVHAGNLGGGTSSTIGRGVVGWIRLLAAGFVTYPGGSMTDKPRLSLTLSPRALEESAGQPCIERDGR